MNRILSIDISGGEKSQCEEFSLPDGTYRKLIGGRGLGAYLLYKHTVGGEDPLGALNPLIFTVGPFQKESVLYNARAALTTKSPLTNGYLYSICGGSFGAKLANLGYCAMIVKGWSPEHIYLLVTPDGVEVKSAGRLWGRDTLQAHDTIKEEVNDSTMSAAVIGPAGERLVRYSGIFVDGDKFRAFARGGPGCVMGAKNLKGVVLADRKGKSADPVEISEINARIKENIKGKKEWADEWIKYGTSSGMDFVNKLDILPTENFSKSSFDAAYKLDASYNRDKWKRKNTTCGNCPTPCPTQWRVDSGDYSGVVADGPEYETSCFFGSNLCIDRFDAVLAANSMCDLAGLDTISAGHSISFAIECFREGLIGKEDTGGLDLKFGDDKAALSLLQMIIDRQGIGDILAEGVKRASAQIPGSEDFAVHVKGLEAGAYHSKNLAGQAINFAMNPRGGCHHGLGLIARFEKLRTVGEQIEGKGGIVARMAVDRVLADCGVLCSFPGVDGITNLDIYLAFINAITDGDYHEQELREIALAVVDLEKCYNVREGFTRADDSLPKRLLGEFSIDDLLSEGYKAFDWDLSTGIPRKDPLRFFEN